MGGGASWWVYYKNVDYSRLSSSSQRWLSVETGRLASRPPLYSCSGSMLGRRRSTNHIWLDLGRGQWSTISWWPRDLSPHEWISYQTNPRTACTAANLLYVQKYILSPLLICAILPCCRWLHFFTIVHCAIESYSCIESLYRNSFRSDSLSNWHFSKASYCKYVWPIRHFPACTANSSPLPGQADNSNKKSVTNNTVFKNTLVL